MFRNETIRQGNRSATADPRRFLGALLWLTAVTGLAQAGEVYKSVDANGNVVYSDQPVSATSQSIGVRSESPEVAPPELHFCWTNCFTLILDNGVYRRTDGTDESWTVESFSTRAIVLHRHDPPADWNGYSADVVYAGRMSNDRLVGVTINGNPANGIEVTWGTALNSLPGSNADRDASGLANAGSSSNSNVSSASTPPPLPSEDQPVLSQDGNLWTPGYWYWRDLAYVWIPGAWVRPPRVGVLWTPAYWSFNGTVFVFHPGYWGSSVGYYGGVNYGNGYFGTGYNGGHWVGSSFAYNSAVNHLNPAIAHRASVESASNQGSRGVSGNTAVTRKGTESQYPSKLRSSNKPASTPVQRTSEPAPTPANPNRPAPVAKTPAPSAPKRSNEVAATAPAPARK
jgi:hypothetical protein